MTNINVDLDKCEGCKRCVDACFVDVIRWNDEEKQPVFTYLGDCVWCLGCEIACTTGCLEVVPDVPGPFPLSY